MGGRFSREGRKGKIKKYCPQISQIFTENDIKIKPMPTTKNSAERSVASSQGTKSTKKTRKGKYFYQKARRKNKCVSLSGFLTFHLSKESSRWEVLFPYF